MRKFLKIPSIPVQLMGAVVLAIVGAVSFGPLPALDYSMKQFVSGDESHAVEIMQLEDEIDKLEKKFQKKHVNRLANNKCEPHAAMIFSDLLSNLERVADHGVNIAFAEQDEEEA